MTTKACKQKYEQWIKDYVPWVIIYNRGKKTGYTLSQHVLTHIQKAFPNDNICATLVDTILLRFLHESLCEGWCKYRKEELLGYIAELHEKGDANGKNSNNGTSNPHRVTTKRHKFTQVQWMPRLAMKVHSYALQGLAKIVSIIKNASKNASPRIPKELLNSGRYLCRVKLSDYSKEQQDVIRLRASSNKSVWYIPRATKVLLDNNILVPPKSVVIHLNGDSTDDSLGNLQVVSDQATLNRARGYLKNMKLKRVNPSLVDVALEVAEVMKIKDK